MLAHVKYGNECGDHVMEFSSNHIITVNNASEWKKALFRATNLTEYYKYRR